MGRLSFEVKFFERSLDEDFGDWGGGREHALVWKLKQSARVEKIWCAPGNGGIAEDAECVPVDAGDVAALVALAEKIAPDLTVVGPELPLVNGISDAFAQRNWAIVGPSKKAAQLEGSKIFSKEFLLRHNIPTAKMYGAFDSAQDAYAALSSVDWPLVIKADGLCAGKGVYLAPDAGCRAAIPRTRDGKERAWRRRAPRLAGRDARGRGAVVHHFDGRRPLCADGADARSQAGIRRQQGTEHRRDGSIFFGRIVA